VGTPALTTRGMKESDMRVIAGLIGEALAEPDNEATVKRVRERVRELCDRFPIYENRLVRSRAQLP
ncbi:MAG TPA: serine hydroxymethyltransferase, partial [Blastocatellia bacterium]|nr:serine hydroxymethyltransferase [Blastocatellia bacterium]